MQVSKILFGGLIALALIGCGSPSEPEKTSDAGATPAGGAKVSGSINIDGSTTVFPIVELMGADFGKANDGVKVTVNKSGTGSGIKKFIAGEIDVATASRPIEAKETDELKAKGIDFIELPIAFDGVTVVVNPDNTWAASMTTDELKKAWAPDSTVKTWGDINAAWPKDKVSFFGPTDNHGTYEYFTEAINGKKNAIRRDYNPNQEYTTIVQGVAGDKNAIGFVGFNYYEENKDKVKAVTVNGVAPSAETIAGGAYSPLSRPLFLYVRKDAAQRPEVKAFLDYALGQGLDSVEEAAYVKLPAEAYEAVKKRLADGVTGSVFQDAKPGMKITEILAKEATAK